MGFGALVAAPAIVRFASIMPVKTMPVGLTVDALTVAKMIEAKRLFQVYGRSPAMLFMPEARALVELEASIVRKMGDAYCG